MTDDPSVNSSISLRQSILKHIDEHRVNNGLFKSRSEYAQTLILRDITLTKIDYAVELMSLLVTPTLFFGFFMILAVLTQGLLFYLFMGVSGILMILFSFVYSKKRRKRW